MRLLLRFILVMLPVVIPGAIIASAWKVGPPLRPDAHQCGVCQMGIWDTRFAAAVELEVPAGSGAARVEIRYYDDMGCLLDEEAAATPGRVVRRRWVRDAIEGRDRWLDAATARFLMSGEIKTPMGSGIAACASELDAERLRAGLQEPVASETLEGLRSLRAAWREARGLKP